MFTEYLITLHYEAKDANNTTVTVQAIATMFTLLREIWKKGWIKERKKSFCQKSRFIK